MKNRYFYRKIPPVTMGEAAHAKLFLLVAILCTFSCYF